MKALASFRAVRGGRQAAAAGACTWRRWPWRTLRWGRKSGPSAPVLRVGVWLLLWPLATAAQVERTSEYLQKMDSDGDGRISQAEYVAWMGYAFEGMDRNGDGLLSADEQPGGKGRVIALESHRQRLAERFRRQDANGDGWLDARELAAPPL